MTPIDFNSQELWGRTNLDRVRYAGFERLKAHPGNDNVLVISGESLDLMMTVAIGENDIRVQIIPDGEGWAARVGIAGNYIKVKAGQGLDNDAGYWE